MFSVIMFNKRDFQKYNSFNKSQNNKMLKKITQQIFRYVIAVMVKFTIIKYLCYYNFKKQKNAKREKACNVLDSGRCNNSIIIDFFDSKPSIYNNKDIIFRCERAIIYSNSNSFLFRIFFRKVVVNNQKA